MIPYRLGASLTDFISLFLFFWLVDYLENAVDTKHLSLKQACHNLVNKMSKYGK